MISKSDILSKACPQYNAAKKTSHCTHIASKFPAIVGSAHDALMRPAVFAVMNYLGTSPT